MRVFSKNVFLSCALIIFMVSVANGQTYRNLIFEGAGIRGVAYAGALMQLQEQKILDSIKRVGGTSAGAITALVVAIGYSPQEIYDIIANTEFQKFNDGKFIFFGGFHRVRKNYGWYLGEAFSEWLAVLIEKKTGNRDITFKQLHERGFKDLYVTGTSLNRQKLLVFSHESFPDMKVRDAIRISMSIPLYYEAVHIDSTGKIVHNPKDTKGLDVMVDGGILSNYPIQIFDSTKYFSPNAYMDQHSIKYPAHVYFLPKQYMESENVFAINPETLGVRIDSEAQINAAINNTGLAHYEINEFTDYVSAFYNIVLENLNRYNFDEWKRTISVSSKDIGPKVKKLSNAQKQMLLESGRSGVKVFFEGK